jgi:hypothetical protein
MEKFAGIADDKGVRVILRGVRVDVYKVLKLVRLAPRFASVREARLFASEESSDAQPSTR